MNYLKKSKLFYVFILLITGFILWEKLKEIDFLVTIVNITINILFIPSILSLFFYYILKPWYLFLLNRLKNEILSLILAFATLLLALIFLVKEFIPLLLSQIGIIMIKLPNLLEILDSWIVKSGLFKGDSLLHYLSLINRSFEDLFEILIVGLQSSTNFFLSFISSSFLIISLVPLIVLYLLRRTEKPKEFKYIPLKYRQWSLNFFYEVEKTLSNYIAGKAVVCFYVFIGAWITFTFAGLEGALVFAVIAGLMDVIPYFGPWIGAFPAVLSSMLSGETNVLFIIIGILIVQLGESYVVSPYIMSKELKMNPLAVIVIMLISGKAFGIIGMIIALPVIATLRVCILYLIKLVHLQRTGNSDKLL